MSHEKYEKMSISLPADLLAQIDELARKEDRSRSNMIARICADCVNADSINETAGSNTYATKTEKG